MAFWKRDNKPVTVGSNSDFRGDLDTNSATWHFIQAWADEQIEKLRVKNENVALSEVKTAEIRGRIRAMRLLKNIPNERKGILSE